MCIVLLFMFLFLFVGSNSDLDWDEGLVVPQPGPPAKRAHKDPGPMRAPDSFSAMLGRPVINHLNGKTKIATMTRSGSGRKQVISWMDAPDDVYFRSTDGTKNSFFADYTVTLAFCCIDFQENEKTADRHRVTPCSEEAVEKAKRQIIVYFNSFVCTLGDIFDKVLIKYRVICEN
uniref:(California timema) hypothetical protein n=1 Tax=Timema californicum TaxID=61474 RepID=A0A7R9IZE0_TIMCA|nr:unnamed protein product [Timema californicum]